MAESSYLKFNWKTLKWIILMGFLPPSYFQIKNFVFYDLWKIDSLGDFVFWSSVSIASVVILSIVIFREIKIIDRHFPWEKSVGKRLIIELLVTNITVAFAMIILAKYTYPWHCAFIPEEELGYKAHVMQELTVGAVVLIIMLSFVEGSYFFGEWKKGLLLTEQLKKESLQAQLESLKNQVNPHFLFNSLNVLSNLVHKDADRAEEFIDQFASVYRYVLNIQDKTAVTLEEELKFIDAYIFLQKIRFQNGFEVEIDINKDCYGHYVVPLSLQMMLENAIKHNIVSAEEPLLVKIHLEDDKVHVENKINLRSDENNSLGMGLKNLRQRYFLLAGIMPEIKKENGIFFANIPLIKPEKSEEIANESECCNHRRRKIRSRKA